MGTLGTHMGTLSAHVGCSEYSHRRTRHEHREELLDGRARHDGRVRRPQAVVPAGAAAPYVSTQPRHVREYSEHPMLVLRVPHEHARSTPREYSEHLM
jgi:hypothetical protein